MLELALVENIQRADLNPLEEALAYQQLTEEFGLTQQEIADKVGKGRVSVANALRLLRLPDFAQNVLVSGQISEGHARALLSLVDDPDALKLVIKRIISQRLSVRQTEELARRLSTMPPSPKASRVVSAETRKLEESFARSLGTKVNLTRSKKGGRLTIYYFSEEELQSLYDRLVQSTSNSDDDAAKGVV
jgi:ParB family chromosome partitioning protein